ncbi:MAG TPA: hypothetical protein VNX01_11895 [Bacteroidia bacterium]|jgi:hypothetical protein|nr:hypothetical protein [Bacteroidia bacterium]
MARNFGIVEGKVIESAYFFSKLEESINKHQIFDDAQFLLSAFLSASRSITFTLQASISDLEGFDLWYAKHQDQLKKSPLARFFLEARNMSQKVGHYLIRSGVSERDTDGKLIQYAYFGKVESKGIDFIPEEDVVTSCKAYFALVLEIVLDCYKVFGRHIDAAQLFTIENLVLTNRSIEDFEELAGYPRGYTSVPGVSDEERMGLLRRYSPQPSPEVDKILVSFLGINRFGEKVELDKNQN